MPIRNHVAIDFNAVFDEILGAFSKIPLTLDEKRFALIAEVQRIGLCYLFQQSGKRPVHQLSLRRWVQRKLDHLVPELFSEGEPDYRDVLLDGHGTPGSLDFLGDVVSVGQAGLCPAPTRAVPITADSFALASGLPTASFSALAPNLRLSILGRTLVKVSETDLARQSIPLMSRDAFLQGVDDNLGGAALIERILSRAPSNSAVDKSWQCYQGHQHGRFDFLWATKRRPFFPRSEGPTLILWQEPLSRNGRARWLARADRSVLLHRVEPLEWKRLCLALDEYEGNARHARISQSQDSAWLYLSFRPWLALYRWLLVAGAVSRKRPMKEQGWRLPLESVNSIVQILSNAGVSIQMETSNDHA